MKVYKSTITLNRNNRGCYILDTVKGCPGGCLNNGRGCYGDCYAKNIADRYGFNFCESRARIFENDRRQLYLFGMKDQTHTNAIIRKIKSADMSFIRIGEMGDPSADWRHTISVCKEISCAGKRIVIITKHWNEIPEDLLKDISKLDLCINTSVSALDDFEKLEYRLSQYNRLKNVCQSVLRVVSCDFNRENTDGIDKAIIQDELFKLGPCIDTVFRPSQQNYFVTKNVIKTQKVKFLRSNVLASVYDKNTYLGTCQDCPDMCGTSNRFAHQRQSVKA